MAGSLMAVIDNKISDTEKVVAFETGKNDRWIAYKFPREIYFKRLERSNSQPQPEHKACSFHNCTVKIYFVTIYFVNIALLIIKNSSLIFFSLMSVNFCRKDVIYIFHQNLE